MAWQFQYYPASFKILQGLYFMKRLAALFALLLSVGSHGLDTDIRLSSQLSSFETEKEFSLSVSDCTKLAHIEYDSAIYPVSDATRLSNSQVGCQFLGLKKVMANQSQITLDLVNTNGSVETVSESFILENEAPLLNLKSSSVSVEPAQVVNLAFSVSDDTDLSYLKVSVQGLRVSDLRNAGGVVEAVKSQLFVDFSGRFYPSSDLSTEISMAIPFSKQLPLDVVAGDGILIIEAEAVDASGNISAVSEFEYTGETIEDEIHGFSTLNGNVLITNMLDYVQILPVVKYKFRGEVPLVGQGSGASYEVSDSEFLGVTESGVVFAKKEADKKGLSVRVNYPGAETVTLPIELAFSRKITSLYFTGYPENTVLPLIGLNQYHELPQLSAKFDDGSIGELSDAFPFTLSLADTVTAFADISVNGLASKAEVSQESPIYLNVTSSRLEGATFPLPVSVADAPPEVSLKATTRVAVGGVMELNADVSDDVQISKVTFKQNGSEIASRDSYPYTLNINAVDSMNGSTFQYSVVAIDNIGQETESLVSSVTVGAELKVSRPSYVLESPGNALAVVEGSFFWYRAAHDLGEIKPTIRTSSNIASVKVFLDDEEIGSTRFPKIEERNIKVGDEKEKHLFEVWEMKFNAPSISTHESSRSIYAQFTLDDGSIYQDETRLIRIIENKEPTVLIASPENNATVTAGQSIRIEGIGMDDTLYQGSEFRLYVNDKLKSLKIFDLRYLEELEKEKIGKDDLYILPARYLGAFATKQERVSFNYLVPNESIGESIDIKFQAKDLHGELVETNTVKVLVAGDQPPSSAITSPVNSQYITEGETIRVSAASVDDVSVKSTEFFVNGTSIGVDLITPYSAEYVAPENIASEQILEFWAVVTDSAGQRSTSQVVKTTLGHDDRPPVIDWVSPEINATEGAESIANVPEQSTQVLKFVGFDNVGIADLEIQGLKKTDIGYQLTGDLSDVESIEPVLIPNTLNQFSVAILVDTPKLNATGALTYASYKVAAVARDKNKNESRTQAVIRVNENKGAEVSEVNVVSSLLSSKDTLSVNVISKDDVAVSRLVLEIFDGEDVLIENVQDLSTGLIPRKSQSYSWNIPLTELSLGNFTKNLKLKITAIDNLGESSDEFGTQELNIEIVKDTKGPSATIISPVQGSEIILGDKINFALKALDVSGIKSWRLLNGSTVIYFDVFDLVDSEISKSVVVQSEDLLCEHAGCESSTDVELTLESIDDYGNKSESIWRYTLRNDQDPAISIRLPAQGARY
ncbi:MAG: Ig-like domain-containing protein, partial [Colwellia sp.]